MGGASSKAARRLPTTTPTAVRSVDPHIPPPDPLSSPTPMSFPDPLSSSAAQAPVNDVAAPHESPRELGPRVHANLPSSGEKNDEIRRDALDPHFASNLLQLGPVYVAHPSRATAPALAQRTLTAQQTEDDNVEQSGGSLNAATLSDLLRKLQNVPDGEAAAICGQYGVDPAQMERLRKWISVPEKEAQVYDQREDTPQPTVI